MPDKIQTDGVGKAPCKTELGKFIRARRLELGLKQIDLARTIGTDQQIVSLIETGKIRHLDDTRLEKLSKVLKCDSEELRTRTASKAKKTQPAGVAMTPCKTELGRFIRTRRLELGLRQIPLAKRLGEKQQLVSLLETGQRKYLDEARLVKLAIALECNPEELRERMPKRPGGAEDGVQHADPIPPP